MSYSTKRLTYAISAISPDIKDRVFRNRKVVNERGLWWELSTCILSSQVPYSLAVAASDKIDSEGLLLDHKLSTKALNLELVKLLRSSLRVKNNQRRYRFPEARARHLAYTHAAITAEQPSLFELVNSFQDASEARKWFIKHAPGLGPKQASMFLRNTGVSYDLAILDRHVLSYMSKLGLFSGSKLMVTGFAQYEKCEKVLRKHAEEMNCQVGILDWAIWIVMRVANTNMEPVSI